HSATFRGYMFELLFVESRSHHLLVMPERSAVRTRDRMVVGWIANADDVDRDRCQSRGFNAGPPFVVAHGIIPVGNEKNILKSPIGVGVRANRGDESRPDSRPRDRSTVIVPWLNANLREVNLRQ